jgi:ribosome-associated heat shock protein Hsp15
MSARDAAGPEPEATQRLDKWLWFARVVKTRTLAAGLVEGGKVRINRARVEKPSHSVRVGDVITVTAHRQVRVLKVLAPGVRRGPPTEARKLFEELSGGSSAPGATAPSAAASGGTPVAEAGEDTAAAALRLSPEPPARPGKRDRRALIALKRT